MSHNWIKDLEQKILDAGGHFVRMGNRGHPIYNLGVEVLTLPSKNIDRGHLRVQYTAEVKRALKRHEERQATTGIITQALIKAHKEKNFKKKTDKFGITATSPLPIIESSVDSPITNNIVETKELDMLTTPVTENVPLVEEPKKRGKQWTIDRSLACQKCDRVFAHPANLGRHMQTSHNPSRILKTKKEAKEKVSKQKISMKKATIIVSPGNKTVEADIIKSLTDYSLDALLSLSTSILAEMEQRFKFQAVELRTSRENEEILKNRLHKYNELAKSISSI